MPEYRRGIVIENPHSSYARHPSRARKVHHQLTRTGLSLVYLPSRTFDEAESGLYKQKLHEGDVVFGVGGDGTANYLANLAMSEAGDEIGLSRVPFVPIKGGNACDIAHMLNGSSSMREIITEGSEIDVHAIEVSINGQFYTRAIGYVGLNADAHASVALDEIKPTFRLWQRRTGLQLAAEAMTTLNAMANADPIEVSGDDGEWQEASQVAFYNGDRIAKLGRPHARLDMSGFETLLINARSRSAVLGRMLQMGVGKLYGTMADKAEFLVRPMHEGKKQVGTIAMQVDGEVSHIPSDSSGIRIRAKTADRTFRSISTRLPK